MAARKGLADRRAEVGQAVERAVAVRGIEGLRLKDVAAEIGVTPAALLYYGDLDTLVRETYQQAIERFSSRREEASSAAEDARDQLRACIDHGVASGPDDTLPRLLFEYWPRTLRDARASALDSALTERQIAVYYGVLVLGQAQGHFAPVDPPRLVAANLVALEDGYQMDVLAGRRTKAEVVHALRSYVRAATGCDLDADYQS